MEEKQILIVCGEASGDLNAAGLVRQILRLNPQIRIAAVGGLLLRQAGAKIIYDIQDLSVMGFFDVLRKLPRFFALRKSLLQEIRKKKFNLVILVDFSGFNLRLAKAIHPAVPIIYYISPQVWASRIGRIKTIKKYIAKMLVFFKFEEEFYRGFDVEAEFIGHPLLDIVKPTVEKNEFRNKYGLKQANPAVVLLPGSRKAEIKHILPVMLEASILIHKQIPQAQFIIAKSTQVELTFYHRQLKKFNLQPKIIEGQTYDCLQAADFALVCSGTATLETAIMQVPFVVIYKMGLFNYLLYRPQVKVPFIAMVNIVAGKLIVPEFIQFQANARKISAKVAEIMQNPSKITEMKNSLGGIKSLLYPAGAAERAAKIILEFLYKKD
jgi:lipid-A-disaccharide synthase